MALPTEYRLGDNEHALLRKILQRLNEDSVLRQSTTQVFPVTTSGTYAVYDVVGGVQTLSLGDSGDWLALTGIVVVDKDSQAAPLEFYVLSGSADTSSVQDNAPVPAALLEADNFLGRLSVTGADYTSLGTSTGVVASVSGLWVPVCGETSVKIIPVVYTTPTYTDGNLSFRLILSS